MMSLRKVLTHFVSLVLVAVFAISVFAQGRASLRGLITDEFGAAIVGATVPLTDAAGAKKNATTNADGTYSFTGLTPGKFTIHAIAKGFAASEDAAVDVSTARRDPFNISLKIAAIETQVKVEANAPLSPEPGNNANQQVISGKDLEGLPDDPDELAAALQALAGPSIGPNGGQIFIDGFSGGNMPPKESIREIRINQNPFSAENDQPSARIEILTKPGTDKLRGNVNLNFNDESLNSRNPFAISSSKRTPFQIRQFGGNLSGPLKKGKASFFLEANRNETDDNDLVRATILDPSFNFVQIGQGVVVPRRFTNLSPRLDYAINARNTLVARYGYNHNVTQNNGVGAFSLPERGYNNASNSQSFQVTETAVINATTVNETRFQFNHNRFESLADSTRPVLNVSGAFVGGGSQVGHAINTSNRWELSNFTQIQKGTHTIKFGGRVRDVRISDVSPNNFGGQWIFNGGGALTSIQRYQLTLQLMQAGTPAAQIRAQGGGASQFSINTGNPLAIVSQFDIEPYIQDDWRYKPNLTFSYGLRYEIQNNAGSKLDFAPRVAVAWSPGAANSTKPPKTVIRAGAGIFYNRFSESQTLLANRFNGVSELIYSFTEPSKQNSLPPTLAEQANPLAAPIYNLLNSFGCVNGTATPDCVTKVPSLAGVSATQQTTWRVIPNLQIPTVYVAGGQVERQLPHNFTASVGVYAVRVLHVIRARDINAPLPGTIDPITAPSGVRPIAGSGDINQLEASGRLHQEQMFIGFNSRLNPQFSLSGNYVLSKTTNDTDGQGGPLFPANSYDLSGEFGRGGGDVRHRFFLFGTYNSKLWKLVFAPFLTASSAPPFNIVTGKDSNQDRQLTERPTFAALSAYCTNSPTHCGGIHLNGNTSNQIIPRNFGQASGQFTANLRITRTFGFGDVHKAGAANQSGKPGTAGASGD